MRSYSRSVFRVKNERRSSCVSVLKRADMLSSSSLPFLTIANISLGVIITKFLVASWKETQEKLELDYKYERPALAKLKTFLAAPKSGENFNVIVIDGVRRCGKTHLIRQVTICFFVITF